MEVDSSKDEIRDEGLEGHTQEHYQRGAGALTLIKAKTSVANVWFSMFLGQNYTNVASF